MFSTNSKRFWSYAKQQIKAAYHMNSNYDHQKPSQSADPQTIKLEDDDKSRKINSLVSMFEVAPVWKSYLFSGCLLSKSLLLRTYPKIILLYIMMQQPKHTNSK